jgi:SAM-dependent methyltransferase
MKPKSKHDSAIVISEPEPLQKLDLGAGENCREGFKSVDLYAEKVDYKVNLFEFPWPWKENSCEELHASHFLEHVPKEKRMPLMSECWRILIPGGKMTVIVPYWASPRSIQDPTHEWPPISEESFLYYNKAWREANKLNHYLAKTLSNGCAMPDFDFTYGYLLDQETAQRNQESQAFYIKHYVRSVSDLQVNLVKRA